MWFLLAICSAIIFGAAGLFMKASQVRTGSVNHMLFGLYAAGALGFFVHSLFTPPTNWFSWSLLFAGIVVGIGSAWGNIIWMKAIEYGPTSLTSLLTNLNIVIVMMLAMIWYEETLSSYQIVGVLLLLIGIAFITIRPNESIDIRARRWYFFMLIAIVLFTFRNGGLKVTSEAAMSNSTVLFIAYFLSMLWFSVTLIKRNDKRDDKHTERSKSGLIWGLFAGICSYGGLQLYALALEQGPANIIAPIFAANSLVIALGAVFFFKEKLTRLQWIAIVILLAGLIFVRM
jgi:drug/metabolite transporter (DMT)-like permease